MRNASLALIAALLLAGGAQARAPVYVGQDALGYGAYLSARQAAESHDMGDAARFFRQSLERDPGDQLILGYAFYYGVSAGDIDGASELAKRILVTTPDDRGARLVLAIQEMKQRDFKGARAEIDKTAKGPYVLSTVALTGAWASAGAGDEAAALDALKSLKGQPGSGALLAFHQAAVFEYLGRTADADAAYLEAIKSDTPMPRLIDAYGRFLERNDRIADARTLYGKLASNAIWSPIVGIAEKRMARGEKPEPLIRRPQDGVAETLFGIATTITDDASADDSVFYLKLALYLRPDFDLANILLGDRLDTMGKYEMAIDAYRKVDADSPYHRMAQAEIASDETRVGRTDDAVRDLKALIAASPDDVGMLTSLGDVYRGGGRFSDAADAYARAIKALGTPTQKDWLLFYAHAISEDRSNNWPAAEADLQQALKLAPDEPQLLNYLGYSWVEKGRNVQQALSMLEKAISLKPDDGFILDSVGWAYYKLGRYDEAAKMLGEAVLKVPGDPTINDHYGDALWKVGRKLDARFQWNHAIAFGADEGEKSKIEKKLADDGDHS